MSSIASLVASDGPIKFGDPDGLDVKAVQLALSQAGYRVGVDGQFGARTQMVVRQFQQQHGLDIDGVVGPLTAALLDAPHAALVAHAQGITSAVPNITSLTPEPWTPHDDTASLLAFYGDPRADLEAWKTANVVTVPCPWTLYYEGKEWPHPVQIHKRCAASLTTIFKEIWQAAGENNGSPVLDHARNFSGSGEYRPVRGSSRLSCHAFWAAIDFDAERLPMVPPGGERFTAIVMPQIVVDIFERNGWTWGGRFTGRQDAMHVQMSHE